MFQQKSYRPTWAEIDFGFIKHNLETVKSKLDPSFQVIGVVKADAYGHGAVQVSQELFRLGVEYLAVSNLDEAIELRNAAISSPILLFGPVEPSEFGKLMEFNIYPTVISTEYARELANAYRFRGINPKVHIKVDTGMGRLGIPIDNALIEIEQISKMEGMIIDGIYSHFPSAESDMEFSNLQIEKFTNLIENIRKLDIKVRHFHIANSGGVFHLPGSIQPPFTMARPGLALYGYSTTPNTDLKNTMTLKTRIMSVNRLKKGDTVSYLRTYTIERDFESIAVLPIGYADGIPVSYSNKGKVWIHDSYYPVVGRVCMDYMMVSLGSNPRGLKIGDEVIVLGGGKLPVEEFGKLCGKIPYEVTCDISKRVPRIYIRNEDRRE